MADSERENFSNMNGSASSMTFKPFTNGHSSAMNNLNGKVRELSQRTSQNYEEHKKESSLSSTVTDNTVNGNPPVDAHEYSQSATDYDSIMDENTQSSDISTSNNATGQNEGKEVVVGDYTSTCIACGKKAPSSEFILPDKYCTQSCADRKGDLAICHSSGSSSDADSLSNQTSKAGHGHSSHHHMGPGKRKKKRASYLSAYEENFRMDAMDDRKSNKAKKVKPFSWPQYISDENLKAAPVSVFINEPKTSHSNQFSIGQKLEGIDPLHPSLYCVLTVVEMKGLRLRLHFDGYCDSYDFWVNCYSDEIFPVGWCEQNGKELNPPKGVTKANFSWSKYLSKAHAAPKKAFTVCSEEFQKLRPAFNIGDKIEASDIKNNMLVCVATVADTYGNKVLVHFDGWEDAYDYWCTYNSANIHYVGWCQDHHEILSAPNGYPDPAAFTWESYIVDQDSRAAPRDGFGPVVKNGFKPGMVIEAVDKRNPLLVRAAEILQVLDGRILIHFCGWENKYDYWDDCDSPDIHPIGWCFNTGHPLQPPLTPLEIAHHSGPCPTPGCYGAGHVKGAKFSAHSSLNGCPYSDMNLNRESILMDRIIPKKSEGDSKLLSPQPLSKCNTPGCDGTGHATGKFPTHFTQSGCPLIEVNQRKMLRTLSEDPTYTISQNKKRNRKNSGKTPPAKRTRQCVASDMSSGTAVVKPIRRNPQPPDSEFIKPFPVDKPAPQAILQTGIHNSIFLPQSYPSKKPDTELPLCWDRNVKLLPGITDINYTDVPRWSTEQVAKHLKQIIPTLTPAQIQQFFKEQIDGEAFLLLTQSDITSILNLKLGPALKIYNTVLAIKKGLGYN